MKMLVCQEESGYTVGKSKDEVKTNMNILECIKEYARTRPDMTAVSSGGHTLTYGQLERDSDRLAWYLDEVCGENKEPIAVYGHKKPEMLVAFLACVKSGRAYCPIDISVPQSRIGSILNMLDSNVVLASEELQVDVGGKQLIFPEKEIPKADKRELNPVSGEDVFYIIFTSGSTGEPKGVQITENGLSHFLDWSVSLGNKREDKDGKVFLNQAPFSFDLSVMDLYTCLTSGGTLYCLDKRTQADYGALKSELEKSGVHIWVSTPSFAEVCLSEPSFDGQNLSNLEVFLFCGETLTNRTAKRLSERFPKAVIMNTYGPTESTVAVTEVVVTEELCQTVSPLPVGKAKPGTRIEIRDKEGNLCKDGERGEIVIIGDTVSLGYYRRKELSEKVFFLTNQDGIRGYHTGDKGYMEDGMLFYCGRMDLQIKLHGYRMEIEDIENNILKLDDIKHAVVTANEREGKVKSLTAHVVAKKRTEDARAYTKDIKERLGKFLPEYMIPKKFLFLDSIPMTANGKADRKALGRSGR